MENCNLIVKKTISVKIIEKLRDDIINKRIPPHNRITIKEISERYGVSHMPVREAFQALKGEKFIEIIPYKGAIVLSIDKNFISNVYDLTRVLEGLLIEDAIEKGIDNKMLNEFKDINSRIKALKTTKDVEEQYLNLNVKFHNMLYSHCNNTIVLDIYNYYYGLILSVRRKYRIDYQRAKEAAKQHNKIIEAIEAKDVDAARSAVCEHALCARDNFLKQSLD
jgi:DNA-binding GntR family transcriptional regulator